MNREKEASKLRVLIVCECSGTVRQAFRDLGHEAWSCDLRPADDSSEFHYQCDMRDVIEGDWDLVGMHPDCTYMTVAGIHWNNRGRGWERTEAAVEQVRWLMSYTFPWYLENPVSIISSRIRKPDQIIQPYEFGADASKKTCLWLNKLPKLIKEPSERVPGRPVEWPRGSGKTVERWGNQTDSGQNKLAPSPTRAKDRSRTYAGVAAAMARQYAKHLLERKNSET